VTFSNRQTVDSTKCWRLGVALQTILQQYYKLNRYKLWSTMPRNIHILDQANKPGVSRVMSLCSCTCLFMLKEMQQSNARTNRVGLLPAEIARPQTIRPRAGDRRSYNVCWRTTRPWKNDWSPALWQRSRNGKSFSSYSTLSGKIQDTAVAKICRKMSKYGA